MIVSFYKTETHEFTSSKTEEYSKLWTYRGSLSDGIGINPTVSGTKRTIEVHLFDFNTSIYDLEIKIELLERLRDEQKFETLVHLKTQLNKDQIEALKFITSKQMAMRSQKFSNLNQ